jgi:hypothetical protein
VGAFSTKGDYIPCEFSRVDLLNLRPTPEVATLTAADADAFRSRIIAEVLSSDNAAALPAEKRDIFVRHVAEASFEGLSSSEATGKVLFLLAQDSAPTPDASELLSAKGNQTFAEYIGETFDIDRQEVLNKLGTAEETPDAKIHVATALAQSKIAAAPQNERNLLNAASGSNTDFSKYVSDTFSLDVTGQLGAAEQSPTAKLDIASKAADQSKKADAEQAATGAKKLIGPTDLGVVAAESQTALKSTPAKNQIAQATQDIAAAITRPLDVACSMAVLSYETTRYAFGQKMADEYIPIQVVVRNLNANQEFLVQDAQVAVDDDINGRLGRYASGVDKLTARTYMLSARDYEHRNLVLHLVQGVGLILSSTSLVYGTAVKDAANVYSSGFLTALSGVWTDHGTDHLNLLNDEGFSSYRTERTVVPKSGTAEFVIFISSDQFRQGWWVQDCAENIIIKNEKLISKVSERQSAKCVGQFNLASPNPNCFSTAETAVDIQAARRVCAHYYKSSSKNNKTNPSGDTESQLVDTGTDAPFDGDVAYFKPKAVPYRKWSPTSRALFRELSITVVAGTHIQEQADTKPVLTKVDCPIDGKSDIDFDKAENGVITCGLTGNNLDSLQTLKLRNSADATDTKTASGTVTTTTSSGSKNSKASFTLDSLGLLPAKVYKVYGVTKDGVESGGDQLAHLSIEPYLPPTGKPEPNTLDLDAMLSANAKPVVVTFKGYHLDGLQSIRFAKAAEDKTNAKITAFDVAVGPGAAPTQTQVTVKPDDIRKANISGDFSTQKLELSVALISKDAPNAPIMTKQLLFVTKNATPAAAETPKKPETPASGQRKGAAKGTKPSTEPE